MSERSSRVVIGAVAVAALGALAWLVLGKREAKAPPATSQSVAAKASAAPRSRPPARQNAEARRARDAMRAQIISELERKRASTAPSVTANPRQAPSKEAPPAAAAAGDDRPKGRYEPAYIQKHFREDMFPLMRECYEEALSRRPKLAGKLVLTFTIAGDPSVGGVVEDADFADESDIKDDEMRTCVRESLMTLTFEKPPEGGGYVTVRYPLEFAPGDEDEAAGSTGGHERKDADKDAGGGSL